MGSSPYENAYVGVDPAPAWQSKPINTDKEIERLKAEGMIPHDSLGEPIFVQDEAQVDGESTEDQDTGKADEVEAPAAQEDESGDGGLISPPLL